MVRMVRLNQGLMRWWCCKSPHLRMYYQWSPPTLTSSQEGVKHHVVDLRSDTVTKPTDGMKKAMMEALLGDDVYREDPTVSELENRMMHLTGKDAALFVPSGTMGNLISLLAHCEHRGSEVLLGDLAHIFLYEQAGMAQLGGIQPHIIPTSHDGTYDAKELVHRLRDEDVHCPRTTLICLENTHNKCGGKVLPLSWIDEVGEVAKLLRLPVHMDGARLMNASVASGESASRILEACDTASICFSKGLGTPVGSVIVGPEPFMYKALRLRKVLGGGMRQAGMLAAAALYSLDHMVDRLAHDHSHAQMLAQAIHQNGNKIASCHPSEVHTNIVVVEVNPDVLSPEEFCNRLSVVEEGEKSAVGDSIIVKVLPWTNTAVRFVTHHDVSTADIEAAAAKLKYVIQEIDSKNT
uniref:Aromatic amino acid beta-eliminating lyase/threonine aldolase domain-containing protein n=1 Tax=Scylla olivacea TaxID=85551 RepID=A0A0P4W0E8_SCYOL